MKNIILCEKECVLCEEFLPDVCHFVEDLIKQINIHLEEGENILYRKVLCSLNSDNSEVYMMWVTDDIHENGHDVDNYFIVQKITEKNESTYTLLNHRVLKYC